MAINTTFNNLSSISWWSVLLVEETGVHGENNRPAASHWQTLQYCSYMLHYYDTIFKWQSEAEIEEDWRYNHNKKGDKRTNNVLQISHRKFKIGQHSVHKIMSKLRYSGGVSSSCFTSGTYRVKALPITDCFNYHTKTG